MLARWFGIACLAACATGGPARVRDIDGRPLPPHAVGDASGMVHTVECPDGVTYMVVTNQPPFYTGTRLGTVMRLRHKTVEGVCDRILASGP